LVRRKRGSLPALEQRAIEMANGVELVGMEITDEVENEETESRDTCCC
jgi:hypothetical protein